MAPLRTALEAIGRTCNSERRNCTMVAKTEAGTRSESQRLSSMRHTAWIAEPRKGQFELWTPWDFSRGTELCYI